MLCFIVAGGDGGSSQDIDVDKLVSELLEHDTTSVECRCRRTSNGRRCPYGHTNRRLPTLHPKHIRCHSIHPFNVGCRHSWCHSGISHRVVLLLCHNANGHIHVSDSNEWRRARWRKLLYDISVVRSRVRRGRRDALLHGHHPRSRHVHRRRRRDRPGNFSLLTYQNHYITNYQGPLSPVQIK